MTHHPDDQAREDVVRRLKQQAERDLVEIARLMAVAPADRPPMPAIPANIDDVQPEKLWASYPDHALEVLFRLTELDVAAHKAELDGITARKKDQEPAEPKPKKAKQPATKRKKRERLPPEHARRTVSFPNQRRRNIPPSPDAL